MKFPIFIVLLFLNCTNKSKENLQITDMQELLGIWQNTKKKDEVLVIGFTNSHKEGFFTLANYKAEKAKLSDNGKYELVFFKEGKIFIKEKEVKVTIETENNSINDSNLISLSPDLINLSFGQFKRLSTAELDKMNI